MAALTEVPCWYSFIWKQLLLLEMLRWVKFWGQIFVWDKLV